jgi:hypothetical protein
MERAAPPHQLYMAPDQIEGGEVSERTDLYAFGIVLYEMLTGQLPFSAPTPGAVLAKQLQERPVPPRSIRGEVPEQIERVILQTLEKAPAARPGSVSEVIEGLEAVATKWDRTRVIRRPPIPGRGRPSLRLVLSSPRGTLVAGIGLVVVLGGAPLAWWLAVAWRSDKPDVGRRAGPVSGCPGAACGRPLRPLGASIGTAGRGGDREVGGLVREPRSRGEGWRPGRDQCLRSCGVVQRPRLDANSGSRASARAARHRRDGTDTTTARSGIARGPAAFGHAGEPGRGAHRREGAGSSGDTVRGT